VGFVTLLLVAQNSPVVYITSTLVAQDYP
jgi:hypothetical protein